MLYRDYKHITFTTLTSLPTLIICASPVGNRIIRVSGPMKVLQGGYCVGSDGWVVDQGNHPPTVGSLRMWLKIVIPCLDWEGMEMKIWVWNLNYEDVSSIYRYVYALFMLLLTITGLASDLSTPPYFQTASPSDSVFAFWEYYQYKLGKPRKALEGLLCFLDQYFTFIWLVRKYCGVLWSSWLYVRISHFLSQKTELFKGKECVLCSFISCGQETCWPRP